VDDLDLLRLELEALWVTDDLGRLRHERTALGWPAPLLAVAACPAGLHWATSSEVPIEVQRAIGQRLAGERPARAVGWAPASADELIQLLAGVADVAAPHGGPSYVVPSLPVPSGIELRSSPDHDAASLRGLLPDEDRELTAPWVVAMVDGAVAAVCETARSAPRSVEAGVWTYEPHRRQGLASAVVAAWSALVADRHAFYSTSWDNLASQGVARRLGLRPLGDWWQVSATGRPTS
jgi:RimJ/RimL family protein N-acetyltransferase